MRKRVGKNLDNPGNRQIGQMRQRGRYRRTARKAPVVIAAMKTADTLAEGKAPARACSFGRSGPGSFASARPSRSDLAGEDDDGNAGRETHRERIGDVFDEGAQPRQP